MKIKIKAVLLGLFVAIGLVFLVQNDGASAMASITMAPMNQQIILVPGETYHGSFRISSQAANDEDIDYRVTVEPFYVNESYDIYYENNGDYNKIVDWVSIDSEETGILTPNTGKDIYYSIDTPNDAPAGGQYVAIKVTSIPRGEADVDGRGVAINVSYGSAFIVFAEVSGTTERGGEIVSVDVPGFLFSGKITGTSSIKNTGNVHSTAKYTLQVFPIFSDEEVYTNEEEPVTASLLPDRTYLNTVAWNETPTVGVFKVIYVAEFEGVEKKIEKMVIVCPLWLLFVIVAAVIFILIWIFARNKKRKNR